MVPACGRCSRLSQIVAQKFLEEVTPMLHDALAQLPQQLLNGLTLGGVYSLLALGYSMVYGTLEVINLAHGEVFMVGGFVAWGMLAFMTKAGHLVAHPVVVIGAMLVVAMAVTGLLGYAIERVAFRPVRGRHKIASFITALGVSIVLQNIAMLATGGRSKVLDTGLLIPPSAVLHIGGTTVPVVRILVLCTSIALMLAMDIVVRKTLLGKALRATAEDMPAASYMGIPTGRIIALTFIAGSMLAGAGGVLISLYYTQVDFAMGFAAGIKAFTAAVLGGIGNMRGAMLGGLILGLTESLGVAFVDPVYKDLIVYLILVLLLFARPRGILGEQLHDKA